MIKLPKSIKWIITDFDGVVTDNYAYVTDDLKISRKINFKDVIGFSNLTKNGYKIAIISGESNGIIKILSNKFGITEIHENIRTKIDVLKSIIEKYGLTQDEYVYIGDDINDIACLEHAKYKITVPNAVKKVKEINNIQITESNAGDGAFREVADCLIG